MHNSLGGDVAALVPPCLHTFQGHREAIEGISVEGEDAVSYTGQHIGVFSVQVSSAAQIFSDDQFRA